jgi:hypothetical protein
MSEMQIKHTVFLYKFYTSELVDEDKRINAKSFNNHA